MPKMLSGSVRDSVYYAKGGLFSIDSPFPQDSDLYTYAAIKEKYRNGQASVMFHSSVAGNEFYRVVVERLPEGGSGSIDLEAAADNTIARIQKMQSSGGREPFVLVKEEPWNAKYTSGLIRLYTQKVPAGSVTSDTGKKFFTADNLMYVTKGSGKIVVVLADWVVGADEASPPKTVALEGANKDPIKNAFSINTRAWKFINTINLNVTM